mmetsp:Transcript_949/g.1328  ORF Transcript_949/g.1328 Transcript_949/m.1328 type:complete len:472 (+) Transcript_949:38-1453(+)
MVKSQSTNNMIELLASAQAAYPTSEESTIDPQSPLPSFLELRFVDDTIKSLQDSILLCFDFLPAASSPRSATRPPSSSGTTIIQAFKNVIINLLQRYKMEIGAIILFRMELECLRRTDATIGEACFSLKRVVGTRTLSSVERAHEQPSSSSTATAGPSSSMSTTTHQKTFQLCPLQESDRIKAAFAAALVYYLKNKLELLYQQQKRQRREQEEEEGTTTGAGDADTPIRAFMLQNLFVTLYPYLFMTQEGLQLAYQWCYLFHRTVYTTPMMHILGLVVRRVTASDDSYSLKKPSSNGHSNSIMNGKSDMNDFHSPVSSAFRGNHHNTESSSSSSRRISSAVQIGSFAIGTLFLFNWMARLKEEIRERRRLALVRSFPNNNSSSSDSAKVAYLIPPPIPLPTILRKGEQEDDFEFNDGICPICCEERRIPTVCLASGYVFCYRCIVIQMREHGKCPITGAACSESRLIQLKE